MRLIFSALLLCLFAASGLAQETVYRTVVSDPSEVHVFWLDPAGKRFGQLSSLYRHLAAKPVQIEMLMNGGIFGKDDAPNGLLVVESKTVHPLNASTGKGNFYLQPNGVFYIDAKGAHVLSTQDYLAKALAPRVAVQSGPMLLQNGKIHPAFQAASISRLHRNGVGILPDGKVLFAITEFGQARYPNLYEFAQFFRSKGCRDALFLDGDISQMEVQPDETLKPGNFFSSIIAVYREPKAK